MRPSVLCDALASAGIPSDDRESSKWIFGIARNKVADFANDVLTIREGAQSLRLVRP